MHSNVSSEHLGSDAVPDTALISIICETLALPVAPQQLFVLMIIKSSEALHRVSRFHLHELLDIGSKQRIYGHSHAVGFDFGVKAKKPACFCQTPCTLNLAIVKKFF